MASQKKSAQLQTFKTLTPIFQKVRYLTKLSTDLFKENILGDYIKIIKEYESLLEVYGTFQQDQQNTFSTIKKIKRSSYKPILITKLNLLLNLNNKRFQQAIYVLKEVLYASLIRASESNVLITWTLELVNVYNRCNNLMTKLQSNGLNSNICSNTYPSLLLPLPNLDFETILKLISHRRIEHNMHETLLRILNVGEGNEWHNRNDPSPSSLQVLKILTSNIAGESEMIKEADDDAIDNNILGLPVYDKQNEKFSNDNNLSNFLDKESAYFFNLITECQRTAPSVFGDDDQTFSMSNTLRTSLKIVWTYVSTILDHVVLWWIDTPMACYTLSYVDSFRSWMLSDGFPDTQEPIRSSLKALCELLTIFVSNNVWDQMFRVTLVTSVYPKSSQCNDQRNGDNSKIGTHVGKVWSSLFTHLKIYNNNYLLASDGAINQLAVAEQIPILHRIDHSIHSMRIWVMEQSKLQSSQWSVDVVFLLVNYDVSNCLEVLSQMDLRSLTIDKADILMTVCISLRAKLVIEVNVNISKLKSSKDDCVKVLSSACRTLSLANFSLCFPSRRHWQQNVVDEMKSTYVPFILDQILLPALKSTKDMSILELILKLVCEAWVDYIYSQRIKFTICGALKLLNDFDEVREWISNVPHLSSDEAEVLSNHEVLRMCKGVGKVLVRKPREMIAIKHSPKYMKSSSFDETSEAKTLPSEMFVSNQSHWLELRASANKLSFCVCCPDN